MLGSVQERDELVFDLNNPSLNTGTGTEAEAAGIVVQELTGAAQGASNSIRDDNDWYLPPFGQIHDDYKLANYHPNPDNRKRIVREIYKKYFRSLCIC